MHLDLEAVRHLFLCFGLEQLVSIRHKLLRAPFQPNYLAQEHVDEVSGCHVITARDEHSTLRKPVDYSHDGIMASCVRRQSRNRIDRHTMPFGVGHR